MKRAVLIALYFLAPVLLIVAIYASNPGYYGTSGLLPMVLGAVAYTWLNAQLILSARPKWAERSFGLDRFYRFHSLMAVVAILIAFIHKLLMGRIFPDSLQTKLGDFALFLFIALSALALVFMIDTLTRIVKPLKFLRNFFVRLQVGKYHIQLLLHNLMPLAVVLIFIHVMLSFSANNLFVRLLYILYFGLSAGFYLWHKFLRPAFFTKRMVVQQVISHSPTMTTLLLKPQSGRVFSYLPGQFGFLRFQDPAVSGEEHPFSISSSPTNRDTLAITIKNLGDWTSGVNRVSPGSLAKIDGPYGRFSPVLCGSGEGIVLIAGGVGITPMMGILRYYEQTDLEQKIALLWGVNHSSELVFADELRHMQGNIKNFVLLPVVAAEPDFAGEKGYLSQAVITSALRQLNLDSQNAHYFICGPALMKSSVQKILKAMRVDGRHIHSESFSL